MEVAEGSHTRNILLRRSTVGVFPGDGCALLLNCRHGGNLLLGRYLRPRANHGVGHRIVYALPCTLSHHVGIQCAPEFSTLETLSLVSTDQLGHPAPSCGPRGIVRDFHDTLVGNRLLRALTDCVFVTSLQIHGHLHITRVGHVIGVLLRLKQHGPIDVGTLRTLGGQQR